MTVMRRGDRFRSDAEECAVVDGWGVHASMRTCTAQSSAGACFSLAKDANVIAPVLILTANGRAFGEAGAAEWTDVRGLGFAMDDPFGDARSDGRCGFEIRPAVAKDHEETRK